MQGSLLDDNIGILELKPSKKAKEIIKNNEIYYVSNEKRMLGKNSLFSNENIQRKLEKLEIPYIGHSISNIEEKFDDENSKNSKLKDLEINETTGSFSYTPSSDVEGDVSFKYYIEYDDNKTNISYINFYVKNNSKNNKEKIPNTGI